MAADEEHDTNMGDNDEQPAVEDRRVNIRVRGKAFIPSHSVTRSITKIWKARFTGCWDTWSSVPRAERNIWYDAFKIKYKWDARIEGDVKSVFNTVGSRSFRNFMSKARKKPPTEKPEFMHDEAWQTLCRRWRLPAFIAKSNKGKKAREANKRLHTGGSASNVDHSMQLAEELKREPTAAEIFERTHKGKNKMFVNDEARETWEQYIEYHGADDSLDITSGKISNTHKRWIGHVGSKNGSYYGSGSGVDKYLFQRDTDDEPSVNNSHEDLDRFEDRLNQQEVEQGLMRDEFDTLRNAQEDQSRKLAQVLEAQASYEQNLKKIVYEEVTKVVAQEVGKVVSQEVSKATRQILKAISGKKV
ncbi:hypothetical protein CTI12_AA120420 [Artemisia annua]|uniref:Transposase, Ptta/En/Spm n=1 Tax=Artemisia annua TaxID=35608 RepID=A0A2U1PMW7_ARTAN|nr:hypothetical protein CTI12_AA120420 [Artemisia annua]